MNYVIQRAKKIGNELRKNKNRKHAACKGRTKTNLDGLGCSWLQLAAAAAEKIRKSETPSLRLRGGGLAMASRG